MKITHWLLCLAFSLLTFNASLFAREPLAAVAPEATAAPENCTILPVPPPTAEEPVRITADREDWTYPLGQQASFRVRVAVDPFPEAGVPITYHLGPERFEGPEHSALVPVDGLVVPAGTRQEPGFTRLIVNATGRD